MSKQFWIHLTEWNKDIVTTSLESGASVLVVDDDEWVGPIKELGLIRVAGKNQGDLLEDRDVKHITIASKEDEIAVVREAKDKLVAVRADDWKIIPLENIIAQTDNVLFAVDNVRDAELALTTLEKGAAGVVLTDPDIGLIKATAALVNRLSPMVELKKATVTEVRPVGVGDRICIDTCTMMKIGQGMLIGSSSQCLALVHSETVENPYVATRPFRVNAGGVHAYVLAPNNKTRYLSDLSGGDRVLIANSDGATEEAIVGRIKMEKRPLLLIALECENRKHTTILQNAETVCVVNDSGAPVSVVKLRAGDKILVSTEKSGRHFGMKIDETITET